MSSMKKIYERKSTFAERMKLLEEGNRYIVDKLARTIKKEVIKPKIKKDARDKAKQKLISVSETNGYIDDTQLQRAVKQYNIASRHTVDIDVLRNSQAEKQLEFLISLMNPENLEGSKSRELDSNLYDVVNEEYENQKLILGNDQIGLLKHMLNFVNTEIGKLDEEDRKEFFDSHKRLNKPWDALEGYLKALEKQYGTVQKKELEAENKVDLSAMNKEEKIAEFFSRFQELTDELTKKHSDDLCRIMHDKLVVLVSSDIQDKGIDLSNEDLSDFKDTVKDYIENLNIIRDPAQKQAAKDYSTFTEALYENMFGEKLTQDLSSDTDLAKEGSPKLTIDLEEEAYPAAIMDQFKKIEEWCGEKDGFEYTQLNEKTGEVKTDTGFPLKVQASNTGYSIQPKEKLPSGSELNDEAIKGKVQETFENMVDVAKNNMPEGATVSITEGDLTERYALFRRCVDKGIPVKDWGFDMDRDAGKFDDKDKLAEYVEKNYQNLDALKSAANARIK